MTDRSALGAQKSLPNLRKLDLSDTDAGQQAIVQLAAAMEAGPCALTHLDLNRPLLTSLQARALALHRQAR